MKKLILFISKTLLAITLSAQSATVTVTITGGLADQTLKKKIETNAFKLLSGINNAYSYGDFVMDDRIMTAEGYLKLYELWNDVQFYCDVPKISENIIMNSDRSYQLRNIPVVVGDEIQYLVVNFLSDGTIGEVHFGLEITQYKNVINSNSVIDKTRREIILNFIENFRTAYIRKDIDFIEKVFSEHALIITGRVVQQQNFSGDNVKTSLTQSEIEYQKLTKKEYIERLRKLFNNVGYVILEFEDIEVNTHRKHPNFYGVLLEQYWRTSTYQDKGYLFLMIQFRDDDHPLIWVRTWQDASHISKDEIFGFHNFKILDKKDENNEKSD